MTTTTYSGDAFRESAYTGEGGFANGDYLVQHTREEDTHFENRQTLAVYPNYVRKVVDSYLGTLMTGTVNRTGEAAAWLAYQANADGAGAPVDRLMNRAELLAMLHGTVYLCVDRPQGGAQSRADESQLVPYVVIRTPDEIEGAPTLDARGRISRITFREQLAGKTVYRIWTLAGWTLSTDKEGQDVVSLDGVPQTGTYNFGRVPVVRLHSTDPLKPNVVRATPWANGLIRLNFDLFNLWSEHRNLLRSQGFSIFTIPVADRDEAEKLQDVTVGPHNALTYNPLGGGQPGYVGPPDGPAQAFERKIADCVQRIYELANLEFVGGVQQSGVALAFHFQSANRTLANMAEQLDRTEMEIAALVCAWNGETWDGHIAYPKSFDLVDLAERLQIGMDALTLGLGDEFARALRKGLARQVLGDTVAPETLQRIDDEIDAGGDPYSDRVTKETGGTP